MLQLHRAERADRLVDALAGVLAEPPDDPLAGELVAVHSRGIERWLSQELSARLGAAAGRGDGVCANVEFPFPSRVVGRALAAAAGLDPSADPWAPRRLVWPLLEVIDTHLDEPALARLRAHLEADSAAGQTAHSRRFAAARHVADLFDRYGVHRPQMLVAWAAGRDVDGSGAALDGDAAWQPRLWRLVRARVGVASYAERLAEAAAALRGGLDVPDLPARLSLFGLTALPASYLTVLAALAATREVHLFLLHPSPALWERVGAPAGPAPRPVHRRDDDPTRKLPRHPLLGSWGRDARELQLVVASAVAHDRHRPTPDDGSGTLLARIQADIRADRAPAGRPPDDRPDPRPLLDPADRSLQVHACHGRTRQVEVLRDAILHLLAGDPTLQPRDVVVMCPDIEAYAPLVHAVFGAHVALTDAGAGADLQSDGAHGLHVALPDAVAGADPQSGGVSGAHVALPDAGAGADPQSGGVPGAHGAHTAAVAGAHGAHPDAVTGGDPQSGGVSGAHPAHLAAGADGVVDQGQLPDLRVRLADRAIRQTNPILRVASELLEVAGGRVSASQVLDLAAREPVRRRFRFDDQALERLDAWVAGARIRWGLDAGHRAPYGLGDVAANTWRAGLDRLLLGVAMADEGDRMVGGAVPLDDVEGTDVDLAGRFAELVDRLAAAVDRLQGPLPVAGWRQAIADAADALTATSERDGWQRAQLHRLLDDVVAEATLDGAPSPVPLSLPEVRALLADRLRGRPSRANHRTGDLTVCTLVPMRSVPHRVICLLGMDDGAFPRRTAGDGDDLVDRDPHVGDRDPRTEDRQLLLDALLAAGDHLVITYTGRDECTNEPRPPAVPIAELLDTVDRTARTGHGAPARAVVLTEHPLQAYDPRSFRRGALVAGRVWGFDPVALAGARAKAAGATPAPPFLARPLPPADDSATIALDDLVRFLEHPVKAFLRQRLGIVVPSRSEEPADAIPVELDGLERYDIGDRLLAARLGGAPIDRWVAAERARGTLPPGALADAALDGVVATVDALLACAGEHAVLDRPRASLEVAVALPDGRTLLGTVPDVVGDVVVAVRFSRLQPKHRLAAWARLLAATAAHPSRALSAVTVGRCRTPGKAAEASVARVPPLAGGAGDRQRRARERLACLVDLYDRGLREPLPLYCATSAAWAEATRDGKDPDWAARKKWTTTWSVPREDHDPEHVVVLGGVAPFDDLLAAPAGGGERAGGWAGDEPTRFGRYARRLWDPLLACEEVQDR